MRSILEALVNGAILSVLIAAMVWLILRFTRRILNAASRYMVWWATLGVVVMLPVVYLPIHTSSSSPGLALAPAVTEVAISQDIPAPLAATEVIAVGPPPPAALLSLWRQFPIELPAGHWPERIFVAWALVTLLLLARLAASCVLLERRKSRAFAVPAHLTAHLEAWLGVCETRRRIRLVGSAEITTPMAAGLVRPSILIPARLLEELEDTELDQIGLHETAHLARGDDYALIFQRILEALFALHPVVRWITRRIDLEREIACDDFVVEATGRARPYAACLTRVVELAGGVRASLVAAAATEERSHLARRVEMLLDKTRHTGTRLLKARLTGVIAAPFALAWMTAKAPGLIAFAMPLADAFEQAPPAQIQEPPPPPAAAIPSTRPAIATPPSAPTITPAPHVSAAPPVPYPVASTPAITPEAPMPPPVASTPVIAPRAPVPYPIASTPAIAPEAPMPPPALSEAPPVPALAPLPPQQPPPPPAASISIDSYRSGDDVDWHWRDGLSARDLRIQGSVEFTDDESDIKNISPGGWFSFEESHGFSSRRYQVMADGSGQLTRRYLVDGRETPLDDQGRAWIRALIPEMLRETGFDVPARVRRIMRRGGAPAVLNEIAKIRSNGSKRRYIQELAPIGSLNTDQFQTILRTVRGISSDGDKASLLIFLGRYTLKDSLRDYTFDAVSTINSSGDRRRVLMNFAQEDPSRATVTAVARSAERITSDGDKAGVLMELARHYRGNEEMRRPFFRAVESIHSSGDRARVLMAVIGAAGDHRDTLVDALRTIAGIGSDGDKARVLVHAAGYWKDDDPVRRAYFDAANAINSASDHARVLTAVVGRNSVNSATIMESVRSAERIHSDADKTRVLMTIIARPDASTEVLIAAVQAAARLASDSDKGRLLLEAVQRASGKPALRSEIRGAARTLHSDSEYRRVMTVLDKQMAI